MAKSRKRLRNILIIVGIVAGLFVAGRMCGRKGSGETQVTTAKAENRTIYAKVSEAGSIQPTIEVPVSSDVSGEVVKIMVKEGMAVKQGELLITIQPDNYKSALEQAEAALNQTKAAQLQAKANMEQAKVTVIQDSISWKRTEKLFADKVVSQVDLENAELRYNLSRSQYESARFSVQAAFYQVKSAEASVSQARQNLNRTNIYASMDGTVTQLNVELGQRVVGTMQMAGTEIMKIADLSSMEVVVEINENDITNLTLGDSSRIEVDAFPDASFVGEVTDIAYSATVSGMGSTDQVTNFEVKVRINPASYAQSSSLSSDMPLEVKSPFRPGMTALVEVFTDKAENIVAVPIQSVTLAAQTDSTEQKSDKPQEIVYVYKDGKVKSQSVTTGISDDEFIQVRNGLSSGEVIVTGPYSTLTKTLKDGAEVKVVTEDELRNKKKGYGGGGR